MSQINHLHIQGFRRLKDVDLELRPLCVMVGANGCGKSSLLDSIFLLSESASGELNKKLSEYGGIRNILTANEINRLDLDVSVSFPEHKIGKIAYELSLTPTGSSYKIERENFIHYPPSSNEIIKRIEAIDGDVHFNNDRGPIFTDVEINKQETALSQSPDFSPITAFTRYEFSSCIYYHNLNVDQRSFVRLPQQLRPVDLPGRDGEDIIACLFSLRETDRDRYELIEDTLRAAYPSFDRLEFPPVAAGMMAMAWRDKNYSRPFYMNELSEGMLRYLWLTTLLLSPNLPSITLLDEPEVSLHPELLRLLADHLREASQRSQIFVATHSDSLIRFLNPEEVLVFDLAEDGSAQATWADMLDLEEWLKDYTLDEVWRMGRMGGRA